MIRETYVEIEGYSEDMDRPATELMRGLDTRKNPGLRSSVIVNSGKQHDAVCKHRVEPEPDRKPIEMIAEQIALDRHPLDAFLRRND